MVFQFSFAQLYTVYIYIYYACPSYAWLYTDRDSVSSPLMTKCRDRSSTLPAKDTILFLTYFQNWKDSKKAMAQYQRVFTCFHLQK